MSEIKKPQRFTFITILQYLALNHYMANHLSMRTKSRTSFHVHKSHYTLPLTPLSQPISLSPDFGVAQLQ